MVYGQELSIADIIGAQCASRNNYANFDNSSPQEE